MPYSGKDTKKIDFSKVLVLFSFFLKLFLLSTVSKKFDFERLNQFFRMPFPSGLENLSLRNIRAKQQKLVLYFRQKKILMQGF
jgi:Na+-driven multidrug efflux pump